MDLKDQEASPEDARLAVLRYEALQLRIRGYSYRKIGPAIGLSHGQAHVHVTDALREIRTLTIEQVEELRALENARLDSIWAKLWPDGPTMSTDTARTLLRISDSRRSLNGLDMKPYVQGGAAAPIASGPFDLDKLGLKELRELEHIILVATVGQQSAPLALPPGGEVFPDDGPPKAVDAPPPPDAPTP